MIWYIQKYITLAESVDIKTIRGQGFRIKELTVDVKRIHNVKNNF